MRAETLIGTKVGRLNITGVRRMGRNTYLVTQCDCGAVTEKLYGNVRMGRTKSCGCLETEARVKHGMSDSPTWASWDNMKNRCNPANAQYVATTYAGIKVCRRWLGRNGFANFLADMGVRPKGKTLDRRDNTRGYSPNNCRWATHREQQENRRITKRTRTGKTVRQVAERDGGTYMQSWHRLTRAGQLS